MIADNNARLFVGGLKYTASKSDLFEFFAAAGAVTDVYIALDRERGGNLNRGFGYVQMSSPQEAQAAIDMFDGEPGPGGRKIGVKLANT